METEQEFKVGDIVNLKSSKFSMTIESILDDGRIECVWQNKFKPYKATYKPIVLTHYNENKDKDKPLISNAFTR
jgi:uncharacterized protein YodC (DUF2158 family)